MRPWCAVLSSKPGSLSTQLSGKSHKSVHLWDWRACPSSLGFPNGSTVKNPYTIQEIPGSGRAPGGENDNPLQYTCLKKVPRTEEPGSLWSIGSQRVNTAERRSHSHSPAVYGQANCLRENLIFDMASQMPCWNHNPHLPFTMKLRCLFIHYKATAGEGSVL